MFIFYCPRCGVSSVVANWLCTCIWIFECLPNCIVTGWLPIMPLPSDDTHTHTHTIKQLRLFPMNETVLEGTCCTNVLIWFTDSFSIKPHSHSINFVWNFWNSIWICLPNNATIEEKKKRKNKQLQAIDRVQKLFDRETSKFYLLTQSQTLLTKNNRKHLWIERCDKFRGKLILWIIHVTCNSVREFNEFTINNHQ